MTARTLAFAATLGLLLTGCATSAPPAADEGVNRDAVLAELGPYPADTAWAQAEHDQALADYLDSRWKSLAQLYPDAVRPEVTIEREIEYAEFDEVLADCMDEAGDPLPSTASEYVPQTTIAAEIWFTCVARFPMTPEPPANDAQLGYIYDYLTTFVVPCYEKNGAPQSPAPTKEFFVENWPNQDWYPSYTIPEEGEALDEACPSLNA